MKLFKGALRACLVACVATFGTFTPLHAAEPIKFGVAMALSGPIAGGGKGALAAIQLWANDVNAAGGILGRPVTIISYDDQSNPAMVPALYSKMLDIDKVDFAISGYGTGIQAALIPLMMQRKQLMMGSLGTAPNANFHYDRYFQILPAGSDPKTANSKGFFEVAKGMEPKPKTIALLAVDNEFSQMQLEGARKLAKEYGLQVVLERSIPPNTVDLTPIARALRSANPDIVWGATYPTETVALVRAVRDLGIKPRLFGGSLVGLQYASIKQQLGPALNGIVNYDYYVPEPTMQFDGLADVLKRYQEIAVKENIDPLGYYVVPAIYAEMQVLQQAITKAGSLDQDKIVEILRKDTFKTVFGDIKFGPDGEWAKPRILFVQFQNVAGGDLAQFREAGRHVILYPPELKSGDLQAAPADTKQN